MIIVKYFSLKKMIESGVINNILSKHKLKEPEVYSLHILEVISCNTFLFRVVWVLV